MCIAVAVVVILVLAIVIPASGCTTALVKGDEGVKAAWAQVENQLQRRMDLIPNLVETVKGYASHERETLEAVTEARSRVAGAGSVNEKMAANDQLSGALARLMVVVEAYPNLKADQTFIRLQDELAGRRTGSRWSGGATTSSPGTTTSRSDASPRCSLRGCSDSRARRCLRRRKVRRRLPR